RRRRRVDLVEEVANLALVRDVECADDHPNASLCEPACLLRLDGSSTQEDEMPCSAVDHPVGDLETESAEAARDQIRRIALEREGTCLPRLCALQPRDEALAAAERGLIFGCRGRDFREQTLTVFAP